MLPARQRPRVDPHRSAKTLYSISTLCDPSYTNDRLADDKHRFSPNENILEKGHDLIAQQAKIESEPSSKGNTGLPKAGEEDVFPDGGLRAWLVVVGIFCCVFTAFGFTSTWGVFQAYYETTFFKHSSPTKIAWIGSIQYALLFIPSMIVGRLFDKGHYHLMSISFSGTLVLGTLLLGQCTAYWHFLICHGFLTGLSCGVITAPTPAIISQWFKKRRALALGITACGSAIGGTVFPILIRAMFPLMGFQWTMRALALIMFIFLSIANLTIRGRLPPSYPNGPLISLKPLRTLCFVVWCFGTFFVYLGTYTFQSYVASVAVSKGSTPNFSFSLVAIMNGSSGLGRVSAGIIADHIGSMNNMIPSTILTAAIVLAWPAASTSSGLITISALYGFSAGSFAALLWNPIFDMGEPEELSRRVGILMLFLACSGLSGPPMSGAVDSAGGLQAMSIFAGGCILVGVILAFLTRYMILKRLRGKI
ncbi:MFS general substrate transporter [Marasmius fiardii PR-910]|nr:MFS general substrate transporter [Marasmius fiardii PR-910]